jgi:hypothetical protein
MRRALAVGLAAAALATSGPGRTARAQPTPPPTLTVAVAPEAPTVGDRVTATLMLSGLPAGEGEPRFPVWQAEWGDAEVLDVRAPARAGDTWQQQVVLAFFAPGERILPAVSVEIAGVEETRAVSLSGPVRIPVRSVLPEVGDVEPEPPAPPRRLPLGGRFLWLAGSLALCCLAAALTLGRRRPGGATGTGERSIAPLEELTARLAAIDCGADPVRAWEQAALGLRRFLGRSLGFPALESTTLQIQRLLARRLAADLSMRAVRLLRSADQIKFARHPATAAGAEEALAEIAALARRIEELSRPEPDAGEAAA